MGVNKYEQLSKNASRLGMEFSMAMKYCCEECPDNKTCDFAWDPANYQESILDCLAKGV